MYKVPNTGFVCIFTARCSLLYDSEGKQSTLHCVNRSELKHYLKIKMITCMCTFFITVPSKACCSIVTSYCKSKHNRDKNIKIHLLMHDVACRVEKNWGQISQHIYVIIRSSMWATQCISSGRVTHLLGNYTPSHSVWLTTVRALYPLPLLTTSLSSLQFALY